MSETKFGVGIQGVGWWAEKHIGAYQKNPHTRVTAICGRDRAKLEAKADALKLSCRVYTDYNRCLPTTRGRLSRSARPDGLCGYPDCRLRRP